jgi:hypothetical protein
VVKKKKITADFGIGRGGSVQKKNGGGGGGGGGWEKIQLGAGGQVRH